MSEYEVNRSSVILLNTVASESLKLKNLDNYTKKQAQKEQEREAKKVVARYGMKVAFEALHIYRHSLLDAVIDGNLSFKIDKKNGKEVLEIVPCYSYGIDEYFRSRWPDNWKKVNATVKKKRTEMIKKAEEKALKVVRKKEKK